MKRKHFIRNIYLIIFAILICIIIGLFILFKNTIGIKYPELTGIPEVGKWYAISPEGTKASDGSEWHGLIKVGTENKVVVYFFGGGVSINEATSQQGMDFYATTTKMQDFVVNGGISSSDADNLFKDWTFLVLPYATGDFHAGTGEYHYVDENGNDKIVYHNGYNNYSAFIEAAKKYVGEPDTLLVTGFSAGGFATSLLADDVIERFPTVTNSTVCVDSSLILYDGWKKTAMTLWQSPKEISERLHGNNIVLDSLVALHNKRGDSVKILFDCSFRDDTLQEYQAYINNGIMEKSKENGDLFQNDLKEMVETLKENIPNIGIFIWNYGEDEITHNTQHTIISANVFDELQDDKSIADWIMQAIEGEVKCYGLELLDKTY